MIDIEKLREYFLEDKIFVTEHAAERFHQRNIKIKDIRNAVNFGEIIEQYPNDYPYPSCLSSRIITAYFPDADKWSDDFKTRR